MDCRVWRGFQVVMRLASQGEMRLLRNLQADEDQAMGLQYDEEGMENSPNNADDSDYEDEHRPPSDGGGDKVEAVDETVEEAEVESEESIALDPEEEEMESNDAEATELTLKTH
ncbi:hypothetical protein PHYPSEUDO_005643 [Phytophthora pseudosyringae]|uniref:Uncharacterized protein n=1 Tax=Phytophthora pseudosyringae TaxID=221518 RepID=A0A8T1VLL6_9STRA|nr:hypothetical protein PHYPSEUDO_005643 [Phytophthora pseudosyringae]